MPGARRINFVDDGSGAYRTVEDFRFEGGAVRQDGADWVLTFKDGSKWRFKPFSGITGVIRGGPPTFVTEMTDPSGNVLSITRQSNGRITAVGNQYRSVSFGYGSNGFVNQVTDPTGRVMRYTYNDANRLASVTDADSKVTSYTYRSQTLYPFVNGVPSGAESTINLTTCRDEAARPLGLQIATITYPGYSQPTVNDYGSSGRVLSQTAKDGLSLEFQYKVVGACVANIASPLVKCQGPSCPQTDGLEARQAGWRFYGGRVVGITVKRGDGTTTGQTYNATGRILSSTSELGQTTQYKYDAQNRLVQTRDPLGHVWTTAYDDLGNISATLDPAGRRIEYSYDPKWNKVTTITKYQTDGVRRVWQYQYDTVNGQIIRQTNPTGKSSYYKYTSRGELSGEGFNATSPYRQHSYNPAGDKTSTTDAAGAETTANFDAVGRPVQVTDALGYSSQTQYNGRDQVVKSTNALGQNTLIAYDDAGRVTQVTNPSGVVIQSNTYNAKGNLILRTDALGKADSFEYDGENRLIKGTTRNGEVTQFIYNTAGQLTQTRYPDGTTQDRSYDALDRLVELREANSAMSYRYDLLGRIVQTTDTTAAGKVDIYYTYSRFDKVIARHIKRNDVIIESASYSYDKLDRMVGQLVKSPGLTSAAQITTWRYNKAGQVTRRILPNDIRQLFAYDSAGRLNQIKYQKTDASLIEQIDYTYDGLGRRTSKTLLNGGGAPETPMTATYDNANRMSAIALDPGTAQEKRYSLSYDDNGALTLKQRVDNAGAPITTSPTDTTRFVWDSRGRLNQIKHGSNTPTTVASYSYDHAGRRVSRSTVDSANTATQVTTQYLYNGSQAIGEVRDGVLAASIISGVGVDDAIARITSNTGVGGSTEIKSYLTDALGSVIAQLKTDQSIEVGYVYSPYGQSLKAGVESGNSSTANTIQYTGRENDGAQGGTNGGELYFYRARYYDPVLKRFISQDPIGLASGANFYQYVEGNPISLTDPSGLCPMCIPVVIAACEILIPAAITWGIINSRPPQDAYNPDGAKAPGRPSENDGFRPPKGGDDWVPNPNGRGNGWRDRGGSVWVPTGPGGPSTGDAHGGPHWDVQRPGGGYDNVYPGGKVR
jgi:RHS repeat-associated protein